MLLDKAKAEVKSNLEKQYSKVEAIGLEIARNPELGFQEFKTSELIAKKFNELGINYKKGLAVTGIKGYLRSGNPGPTIAVIGELDAVLCKGYSLSDRITGAAHVCGHNIQVAIMLGVAMALVESNVMKNINGNVVFIGVPAEEYLNIEHRLKLKSEGKIQFLAGKPELIRLGEFDDVDIAILVHSGGFIDKKIIIGGTSNGFVAKQVTFFGKEAHAGATPYLGINALNAAAISINAMNAQREAFKEDDSIRVHSIITKGGDVVNVIPGEVRMESYVRGKTIKAIWSANKKVDMAYRAGAQAMGAKLQITTLPGFLPMINNDMLVEIFKRNILRFVAKSNIVENCHMSGSTDMGDLSHLMPVIHPYGGGISGMVHSSDFMVSDTFLAYHVPMQAITATILDLLWDNANLANKLISRFKPTLTKDKYLKVIKALFKSELYKPSVGNELFDEINELDD